MKDERGSVRGWAFGALLLGAAALLVPQDAHAAGPKPANRPLLVRQPRRAMIPPPARVSPQPATTAAPAAVAPAAAVPGRVRTVIPRSLLFKQRIQRWLPQHRKLGLAKRLRNFTAGVMSLGVIAGSIAPVSAAPTTAVRSPVAVEQVVTQQQARAPAVYQKVRGELVKLAEKQFYKTHEFKVVDVKLGDYASLGFKVKAQPMQKDDPVVAKDANRAAFTAQQSAAGKSVTWVLLGGGLYPKAGFSIPVGPGTLSFSADHMVGYTVLAPYEHKAAALQDAARNVTVDLPLSAEKILAQKEGTEVVLLGQATYTASANVGKGWTVATLGSAATVGAHIGASSSASKMESVQVRIKRLEGSKVSVRVERLDAKQLESAFAAHIGVDSHLGKAINYQGDALTTKVVDLIAKKADKSIERYLQAGVRSAFTARTDRSAIAHHVADLGKGQVHTARLNENSTTLSTSHRAYVGPWTIFSRVSTSKERHGVLDSQWGQLTYDRADVSGSRNLIWPFNHASGNIAAQRELVNVTYPGKSPEAYMHIRHTVENDRNTSAEDVQRFVGLAEYFGARLQDSGQVVKIAKQGKTDRVVDVYVSDKGLQKIAQSRPDQLQRAFAAAYEKLESPAKGVYRADKPWTVTPWMNKSHPRYADVMRMLELGPGQHDAKSWPVPGEARYTSDWIYHDITNRSLQLDHAAYKEQKQLVKLQGQLARAKTPAARAQAFAKAERQLGLDVFREAAMIAQIAGHENVLVNRLAIEGGKRDIVFMREGAIQDPQGAVNSILANPVSGWQR
jgi:hypothetical protein